MMRSMLSLLPSIIALAACVAWPAGATAGPRSRVVVWTGPEKSVEIPGLPLQSLHAPLLDASGQTVGKLDVVLTFTSILPEPDGPVSGMVSGVATLPLGQIALQGALEAGDEPFKLAITGGTEAYRKARGYARVAPAGEDEGTRIVFHLTP